MNVLFTKTAWEQYKGWQSRDEKIVFRIHELIKAAQRPLQRHWKTRIIETKFERLLVAQNHIRA